MTSYRHYLKLKCLECSSGSKHEVKVCPVTSCPLHPVRPYLHQKGMFSEEKIEKTAIVEGETR